MTTRKTLSAIGIALVVAAAVVAGGAAGSTPAPAARDATATATPTPTPSGQASFASLSQVVAPGNTTEMTVELSGVDAATVLVGTGTTPYNATLQVTDGTGDGEVTVVFDTAAAGSDGAFATAADGDSVTVRDQTGVDGTIPASNYPLAAKVDGIETGVSNLLVRKPLDRSTATPTPTATPTATDSPTPTDGNGGDETASPTSSSSPGLGLTAGLIALAGAALLAARR